MACGESIWLVGSAVQRTSDWESVSWLATFCFTDTDGAHIPADVYAGTRSNVQEHKPLWENSLSRSLDKQCKPNPFLTINLCIWKATYHHYLVTVVYFKRNISSQDANMDMRLLLGKTFKFTFILFLSFFLASLTLMERRRNDNQSRTALFRQENPPVLAEKSLAFNKNRNTKTVTFH